ncbi:hypothetical protein D7S86_25590 [Pararobbsia silviterrae]|uniref:Type IV pilus biogenesis and competence protein PilQ n=1 Tax=Pararobbsia silviterrae TaxID=1792498 RepID=A0A494X5V6_9BURK|nr:hypothetical protein D7S86_25590 [Pararobbsia silviterrae]
MDGLGRAARADGRDPRASFGRVWGGLRVTADRGGRGAERFDRRPAHALRDAGPGRRPAATARHADAGHVRRRDARHEGRGRRRAARPGHPEPRFRRGAARSGHQGLRRFCRRQHRVGRHRARHGDPSSAARRMASRLRGAARRARTRRAATWSDSLVAPGRPDREPRTPIRRFRDASGARRSARHRRLRTALPRRRRGPPIDRGGGQRTPALAARRGAASADARTNQLFVNDTVSSLARIREVIERADRPTRQVLIEARIVEAEDGFGHQLGARLSLLGAGTTIGAAAHAAANGEPATVFASGPQSLEPGSFHAARGRRSSSSPSSGAAGADGREAGGGSDVPEAIVGAVGTLYSLPAGALAGFGAAGAGLALLSVGAQRILALELSALEADGRGRIVSSPRIVTSDRIKAVIEQGTELPYQAVNGEKVSGVQFRRAGLKLEVTPQITPIGHVMLDLDITKDTVGAQTLSGPAINTKHVRTQVQVENGGTVAIGGIYIQDERDDTVGIPGLGTLPVIGALFRRHATSRTKSELIVFITPNVVAGPPDGPQAHPVTGSPTRLQDAAGSTKPADSSLIPPT